MEVHMRKQIGKSKLIIIMFLICILFACSGVSIKFVTNGLTTFAASDNSIFAFTPTSETECNVILK